MKTLRSEILLPITLQEAWDFFSSPNNLNKITPEEMIFKITSTVPEKMYEGLLITYKITPILNIPLDWVTEITHINEPHYFVDEQRKGPYRIWHHEHHFKATTTGTLMTDILHYDVGKSVFGWIAEKLYVDAQVKNIFKFRENKLKEIFAV
ncbi:MAG: SRPBCC family protein [Bacteroidetes bacterium]|nr:SRPBCC family protein [Bacteroidota bacterium]